MIDHTKFFRNKSKDFWDKLPIKSHDGNLSQRFFEQNVIHSLVNYYKPKKCIEFGYNVGHSSLLILDAMDDDGCLFSFDIQKTNGDELTKIYPNFTFVHGDSVTEYNKLDIADIDFVLIDSFHSYDQVSREIKCIFNNLKIGSILYFDDTNGPEVYNAILNSEYYSSMREISNSVEDQHLITPFIELNGTFYRNKIIRIYEKIK